MCIRDSSRTSVARREELYSPTGDDVMDEPNQGTVVSVRGSVIDVLFPHRLPEINNELRAGEDGEVVVEVGTQINSRVVRGIALTPARGLARGTSVLDTGRPLQVPVGRELLGLSLIHISEP